MRKFHKYLILFGFLLSLSSHTLGAQTAGSIPSVHLEELTWVEVRDAIKAGRSTVIFPTGGTEQNGPHMVLGKHNFIVRFAAAEIAKRLGNAIVAPVLAYVPEGDIDPPSGHMRFPGTISLPEEVFEKVAEYAARSFRASGFKNIVLIGDSGPNQLPLERLARRLNKEWQGKGVRVIHAASYYHTQSYAEWLKRQGESPRDIGTHAGIEDTSELMAIHPEHIRTDKLAPGGDFATTGVSGNPTRASAAYGKRGLEFRISAAVEEIRRKAGDIIK